MTRRRIQTENEENRLTTVNSSSSFESILNISGFMASFVTVLVVIAAMLYFYIFLPVTEPSNCGVPQMKPVYNIVPMLLPNELMNRERLVLGTDNYRLQNYLKFAGSSKYAYKYRLLRYSNGNLDGKVYRPSVGKNVVLFLPGHGGHFAQIRSLGHLGSRESTKLSSIRDKEEPDYYVVDFNGELSGFASKHIREQTEFAMDCVRTLMDLHNFERYTFLDQDVYDYEGLKSLSSNNKTKFVIVGHSMGGFIARKMLTLKDFPIAMGTVTSIVSLAAPQKLPVFTHDFELNSEYKKVNNFYMKISQISNALNTHSKFFEQVHNILTKRSVDSLNMSESLSFDEIDAYNVLNSISFVSITGGQRDAMVPERFTSLENVHSLQLSFSLDQVKRLGVKAIDHQSILWCKKFIEALGEAIIFSLVPDFRERSSIGLEDKASLNELSKQEKSKISRLCIEIETLAPNEDCVQALENQYYDNKFNYDAVLRLLSYDKQVGFPLPETFTAVEALNQIKSLVLTLTPSYAYTTLLFAIICCLKKLDSSFNFGDHLTLITRASFLTKAFIPVCFAVSLGFFKVYEKLFYYSAMTMFVALLSTAQNGLAILVSGILKYVPTDMKQAVASSFLPIALGVSLYVSHQYYTAVYIPLEIPIANQNCLLSLAFVTSAVFLLILLSAQLLTTLRTLDSITVLLALSSMFVLLSPLTVLYQNYVYATNLDQHLMNLFPHQTVDSLLHGPTKRIQATIPDIEALQQELAVVYKQALTEDIAGFELTYAVAVGYMLPVLCYFAVVVFQYDAKLGEPSITRKYGKWQQARVEAKGAKKKKKAVKHSFKDNSFIVEGEVIETKRLLNSHLNEIKDTKTKEEIILTNDTEYVEDSNVVKSSDKEKVQVDSVKEKEGDEENEDAIPLFKEGRDIRYRKIDIKVVNHKHPFEIIYKQNGGLLTTGIEMLAVLVFFLGPAETWIILPITSLLFSVMLLVRVQHSSQIASSKVYTKIEYKA